MRCDCAIHIAVRNQSLSCLKCLLYSHPQPNLVDVDLEDLDERTALHIAANNGADDVTSCLLSRSPNLDKQDIDGCTPLLLAASQGHKNNVDLLTSANCDLDQRNSEGRTALMEAAIGNHVEVAKQLIQCGCHVNVMDKHGYTALSDAVCGGNCNMVDLLLQGGADVNIQDSRGRAALHIGILYGHNTIASRLIHAGSDVNAKDEDGFTPTLIAAWDPWKRGTLPTLLHLALIGADLDLADSEDTPPIVKAWNQSENVAVLIQNGCNVDVVTKHGFSILELSAMEANYELTAALLSAGAKPPKASVFAEMRTTYQEEYKTLESMCLTPLTLKDQCRLHIRKLVSRQRIRDVSRQRIRDGIIQNGVAQLPLPLLIKNYLMMNEITVDSSPADFTVSNHIRAN